MEPLEGFVDISIEKGVRDFTVTYDPSKLNMQAMQVALDGSGQVCGPKP
jgi:hypothetical protein